MALAYMISLYTTLHFSDLRGDSQWNGRFNVLASRASESYGQVEFFYWFGVYTGT